MEGRAQFVDVSYINVLGHRGEGMESQKSNIFHACDVMFKEDKKYHFAWEQAVHTKLACDCATNHIVIRSSIHILGFLHSCHLFFFRSYPTCFAIFFRYSHFPFFSSVQGDTSGCDEPPVDINTKVPVWPCF